MEFGFATVGSITILCHLAASAVKVTAIDNKWLPVLCGCFGGLLGIAALLFGVPDFPATDYLTAAAVGVASGFAATGIDQVGKQFHRGDDGAA